MLRRIQVFSTARWLAPTAWRHFVALYLVTLLVGLAAVYAFVLLVDPYDMVPFSLPLERRIVSINQRFMYPQIVRSRRFDSLLVGSSTARLIDPQILDGPFEARLANLAMDGMTPWEQMEVVDYFLRKVGPPKVLIVALDGRWCDGAADQVRTMQGFPLWMYDDNPWNDYLHLLNTGAAEIAGRLVGYQLGLYPERIRYDGFQVFVPPESQYDAVRARRALWGERMPETPPALTSPPLSDDIKRSLSFPAIQWLDAMLDKLPSSTLKILVDMPVHIVAQPWPGTEWAAVDAECKARIAAVAQRRMSKLIDWRIVSPLTTNDLNYWDALHYRLPIGNQIAHELIAAALEGRVSSDGSYRIIVP